MDQPSGRFQTETSLKEAGRRTKRTHERTTTSGFDAQEIKVKLRHRIMVVVQQRKRIEVLDFGRARIELELGSVSPPAHTGNRCKVAALEISEHVRKDLVSFISNDDI